MTFIDSTSLARSGECGISRVGCGHLILHDTGHQTGGDGTTTLTDVKALASLSGNRTIGLQDHFDVVTGHDSLGVITIGEIQVSSLICGVVSKPILICRGF